MPIVSIIIPTFNSASTIGATLYSVINQTYKNIEVLVLDNNSKDSTCNIVNEFIKKHPNILLHSESDRGVYDAMNKGIKLSKGDFLYFMGSDDVFYNEATLNLIFTKENLRYDFIYGNVEFKKSKKIYSGKSNLTKLVEKQISICHQAIFYNKRVFEIVGKYNLKYFIHADYDFNIRCFKSNKLKFLYIDIIVAIFNETGLSGTKSNEDNFHTELTHYNISEKYNIVDLYNENIKLKETMKNISKSKEYKLGSVIINPLNKIKRFLFK